MNGNGKTSCGGGGGGNGNGNIRDGGGPPFYDVEFLLAEQQRRFRVAAMQAAQRRHLAQQQAAHCGHPGPREIVTQSSASIPGPRGGGSVRAVGNISSRGIIRPSAPMPGPRNTGVSPSSGVYTASGVSATFSENLSAKNRPQLTFRPLEILQTLKPCGTYKIRLYDHQQCSASGENLPASVPDPAVNISIKENAVTVPDTAVNISNTENAVSVPDSAVNISNKQNAASVPDRNTGVSSNETSWHFLAKSHPLMGIGDSPVELAEMGRWRPPKLGEIKISTKMPTRRPRTSDNLFGGIGGVARDSFGNPLLAAAGRVKISCGNNWLGLQLCALKAAAILSKKIKNSGTHDGPVVYETDLTWVFKKNNMGYPVEVLEASIYGDLDHVDASCETSNGDRFWNLIDHDIFWEWIDKDKEKAVIPEKPYDGCYWYSEVSSYTGNSQNAWKAFYSKLGKDGRIKRRGNQRRNEGGHGGGPPGAGPQPMNSADPKPSGLCPICLRRMATYKCDVCEGRICYVCIHNPCRNVVFSPYIEAPGGEHFCEYCPYCFTSTIYVSMGRFEPDLYNLASMRQQVRPGAVFIGCEILQRLGHRGYRYLFIFEGEVLPRYDWM